MRFTLFQVVLGIYFSLNIYGQKVPNKVECEEQSTSFLAAIKKDDAFAAAILYKSLISNCPETEISLLPKYVDFIKKHVSGQKDIRLKTQLIDSLEQAYLRLEELQRYSPTEDIERARYLLLSPNSNKQTIHKLIKAHLNEPQLLSESLIVQFYANLSALAKEEQNMQGTTTFTQQLLLTYPELSALCTKQNYSVKSHTTLQAYYESSFGSCKRLDNACQSMLKHLPKNKDSLSYVLRQMSSAYEKMNCLASNTYIHVLDSLTHSEKTVNLELKKANHYKAIQAYSSAHSYLESAKQLSKNPREIDSIQLEQCKNLLLFQEFKKAFELCITPKTNYQGEFYIIVAQCLVASPETCKESALQFKLNAYLANEFLVKAKNLSTAIDTSLELKVKNALPSEQERNELGINHDQEITLPCWNFTFKIP